MFSACPGSISNVQRRIFGQGADERQQASIVGFRQFQQAQLGHVLETAVGGAVGRRLQQVLVVLGALLALRILVGVEPVGQPVRQALDDLFLHPQGGQQATELLHRIRLDLALAHQSVEIETPAGVLDPHPQLAAVVQLERRHRSSPGLAQVVHRLAGILAALAQVAAQHRFRQAFAAQRIVPGLAHVQLVGAAAYRQLLADDQPGADDGHHRHHQQHGDQRDAALPAPHSGAPGMPSGGCGTPPSPFSPFSPPGWPCGWSCLSGGSSRRQTRTSLP